MLLIWDVYGCRRLEINIRQNFKRATHRICDRDNFAKLQSITESNRTNSASGLTVNARIHAWTYSIIQLKLILRKHIKLRQKFNSWDGACTRRLQDECAGYEQDPPKIDLSNLRQVPDAHVTDKFVIHWSSPHAKKNQPIESLTLIFCLSEVSRDSGTSLMWRTAVQRRIPKTWTSGIHGHLSMQSNWPDSTASDFIAVSRHAPRTCRRGCCMPLQYDSHETEIEVSDFFTSNSSKILIFYANDHRSKRTVLDFENVSAIVIKYNAINMQWISD